MCRCEIRVSLAVGGWIGSSFSAEPGCGVALPERGVYEYQIRDCGGVLIEQSLGAQKNTFLYISRLIAHKRMRWNRQNPSLTARFRVDPAFRM